MVSVGSTAKVDSVDLQKVVSATSPFPRPMGQSVPPPERETRSDISAAGRLKSTAAATLDAAARLTKPQTWSATKAVSSDETTVQAVSNQAKPGTYNVGVDAIAQAQATATATFSSIATVIGIGTLKIELGSWNASQSTFATNPNWPKANVTMGPKDNSLERVRDKINAAGIGVVASVVSDATGSRLVLRSTSTGENNGFKVEAEAGQGMDPAAASALSAMGFDPSKVSGDGAKLVQPARDARIDVDGRKLRSSQNLVEDEVSGLSLRIKGESDSPVAIRVEPDTEAIRDDIQSFAVTYNELSRQLATIPEGSDDETVKAARDIQSRVQQAFSEQRPDGAQGVGSLPSAGIRMNQAGSIEVDADSLSRALRQEPAKVEQLLAAPSENVSQQGLARRLADIRLPDPQDGPESADGANDANASGETASTAAGALFRQKLLEQQYTAADAAIPVESAPGEEELAIQANAA